MPTVPETVEATGAPPPSTYRPVRRTRARESTLAVQCRRWVPLLGALGLLWACAALVQSRGLISGLLYWEGDTPTYYLPVLETFQAALRHGDLPLWTPHLFGGQPLFAEGEGGMLYPLNVLLAWLLPLAQAYVWEGLVRFGLAGCFAFWFARVLGLPRLSALMSGLVFAFSSFMVAQMHHTNVVDSAVWLPAVLGSAECAVRARTAGRLGWILVGGLALGCAALGVHVEPVLMIGSMLLVWCVFRAVPILFSSMRASPTTDRLARRLRACLGIALIPAAISLLALGVAAAQLLPLYELSQFAARGEGLSYGSATDFSLSPPDLVTLLFPFFFQGPGNHWWSLWFQWETTVYVGIAPLVLMLLAVGFVRTRETWLFGAIAAASLVLALGNNSPINLYWLFWHIPGLAFLRAPARFSLVFTFSGAMLSGYGLQWLTEVAQSRRAAAAPIQARAGPGRGPRVGPTTWIRLVGAGLLTLPVGLLAVGLWARSWLGTNPESAQALIKSEYLTLPHNQASPVDPSLVLSGLALTLDPTHFPTALSLILLASVGLLLVYWSVAPHRLRLCQSALISLVLLDLLVFATSFHQVAPADALTHPSGVAQFLASQPGDYRIFSGAAPPAGAEPDRLLPLGISDAAGYSSLTLERVAQYLKRMTASGGTLLDLMNVRYILQARHSTGLPTYRGVQYDTLHPLYSSSSAGPGPVSFPVGGVPATEVRLIGYLDNDRHVLQGAQVGTVQVMDASGDSQVIPLRAGVEIADQGVEEPIAGPVGHHAAEIAFSQPFQTAEGVQSQSLGYFASLPLQGQSDVTQLSLAFTYPDGQMDVFGLALVDASGQVRQLADLAPEQAAAPNPLASGPELYEDQTAEVDENPSAMDRAFLVYQAASAPGGPATLDTLAGSAFDPRREVLLDGPVPVDLPSSPPTDSSVTLVHAGDRDVQLTVRTAAPAVLVLADTAYPGWHATLDGADVPILTADYLFRAVHVPAGDHTIQFTYDPVTFKIGVAISLATLLLIAVLALGVRGLAAKKM